MELPSAMPFVVQASRTALAAALLVLSMSLQGCDMPLIGGYVPMGGGSSMSLPTHSVAFWRQQTDYFEKFGYDLVIPAAGPAAAQAPGGVAVMGPAPAPAIGVASAPSQTRASAPTKRGFNSCMDPNLDSLSVCGGHGHCEAFDESDIQHPVFFCKCKPGWGDPECRTKRLSQMRVWILSLLFGPLGADEAYLGWALPAFVKPFLTCASFLFHALSFHKLGAGLLLGPWIFDIVRIGSAPVRAVNYRVEPDLPRWLFATFTILFFTFLAFAWAIITVYYTVIRKRRLWDEKILYGTVKPMQYS